MGEEKKMDFFFFYFVVRMINEKTNIVREKKSHLIVSRWLYVRCFQLIQLITCTVESSIFIRNSFFFLFIFFFHSFTSISLF